MALVLNVPSTIDLTKFANGDEVLAKFTQGADGTLTLTDLSANGDVQEADSNDNNDDNGDDNHDGGDDNGDSGNSNGNAGATAGAGVHI